MCHVSFLERRPTDDTKRYSVVTGAFPESSPVVVGGCRVNREPCELPWNYQITFWNGLQSTNMAQRKEEGQTPNIPHCTGVDAKIKLKEMSKDVKRW